MLGPLPRCLVSCHSQTVRSEEEGHSSSCPHREHPRCLFSRGSWILHCVGGLCTTIVLVLCLGQEGVWGVTTGIVGRIPSQEGCVSPGNPQRKDSGLC